MTILPASPKHSSADSPNGTAKPRPGDVARPITDHLEELRRRLLASLITFAVAATAAWFFVDPVLTWLAQPVGAFVFTAPAEAFFVRMKVAAGVAVIAAFPIFLYQGWRFLEVALEMKERSLLLTVLPASCLLFYVGMALALFGVVPIAARFLLEFSGPALRPMISLSAYLSFVIWMIVGFGVFFQLPLAVVALSSAGVINPWKLGFYRKHVVVGILIGAAVLTPGPDIVSQFILAVPSYLLFEVSLILARRIASRPRKP